MTVCWYVASCTLIEADRRFRGVYCLNYEDSDGRMFLKETGCKDVNCENVIYA
jgi:hypothetical protein